MTQDNDFKLEPRGAPPPRGQQPRPGWAFGLRHLYRDVVNEPVPADFRDLIAQLDRVA